MSAPTFQAVGTGSETAPAWPTHTTGDLGLLFVTSDNAAPTAPTGWTAIPGSGHNSGTAIYVRGFYKVATSSSETAPTLVGGGNFMWGVIMTVTTGTFFIARPFTCAGGWAQSGAITAAFFPGIGTFTVDNLIINIMAWGLDNAGPLSSGETNASLTGLTERYDAGTTTSNGGGLILITGTKSAVGNVDGTTCTLGSASAFCSVSLAIQPPQIGLGISSSVSINGGGV